MLLNKFQADQLFTGSEMLPADKVLICDTHGIIQDIVDERAAGDDIQKVSGVLTPGFINCHCHLELSHMRGLIPEKTGLINFVFAVVTQRHFPDDEIFEAIAIAEDEMVQNGIVAVGDISNTIFTLQQKQKKNLRYYNFVEASGWLPAIADQRFLRSKENFDLFSSISSTAIVPHAPYSVSDNLWHLIEPYYENKVVSVHNQETVFEDELFLQNSGDFVRMYQMMKLDTSFFKPSGKSSLQTYFNHLQNANHVLLVHNTFTKEADIEFVQNLRANNTAFFCLCVNANKYIEQSFPPIELLKKHNCNIVLGTDSLASNWSLSLVDEMKTIQRSISSVSLKEMLTWATINGAKALQMHDTLGSFKKGKQPGIILIENLGENDSLEAATVKRLL